MEIKTENTGMVFKNKYKEESDNRPHYKGSLNIGGKQYDIALFVNKDKNGTPYFGAKIQQPYKPQETAPMTTAAKTEKYGNNDDLPF